LCPAGASTSPQDTQAFPVAGSNILLTQDFVAAARGLSEALAALLPSAAALADADPGQGVAAAAAATEAVQGLKSLQGRMASASTKAAAGRCSSEGGAGAAGAASGSVPIQRSVGEGTASATGLMGPPAPVRPAEAAAAASESVFAQQQDFAFSPPGTDAPIRTAALPVPILGSRRSHDGTSDTWRGQMSWTSRPRAVSASGGGDAVMGPASFDSINMSMPRRSLDEAAGKDGIFAALRHSPQDQQMQGPGGLAAGAGAAVANGEGNAVGAQPAAGAGGPWGAEPMIVRQPSRRRSMDGSRPSLDERRQ
jgi:hypothetical protein